MAPKRHAKYYGAKEMRMRLGEKRKWTKLERSGRGKLTAKIMKVRLGGKEGERKRTKLSGRESFWLRRR